MTAEIWNLVLGKVSSVVPLIVPVIAIATSCCTAFVALAEGIIKSLVKDDVTII